jgi:DNA primase
MAVGTSGRVIIDLDPNMKKEMYQKLKSNGLTMKEWFEQKARTDFPELFESDKNK